MTSLSREVDIRETELAAWKVVRGREELRYVSTRSPAVDLEVSGTDGYPGSAN